MFDDPHPGLRLLDPTLLSDNMAVHLLTAILFVVTMTLTCCAFTIWQKPTLPADREDNNKKLKLEAHFRRQVLRENMLATEINKLERELRKKSQTLRHYRHFRQMSSPKGSEPTKERVFDVNVDLSPDMQRETASPDDDDTPVPIPKFYKYLIRRKSHTSPVDVNESWSHLNSPSGELLQNQNFKFRDIDFENGAKLASNLSLGQ